MPIAGAAFGAAQGLEDILAQQMMRAKMAQAQQQQQAQMELERQRLAETTRTNVSDEQFRTRTADRADAQDRQKSNQAGVRRMIGDSLMQRTGPLGPEDRRSIAAMQVEAGDLPDVSLLTEPKPTRTPLHPVTVPGPNGKPMAKGVTDDELAAGVETYEKPPAKADKPDYEWVVGADNTPRQIPKGTAKPGDKPYSNRNESAGRPVGVSQVNNISEIDEALKLAEGLNFQPSDTGVMPSIGGAMPDAVTNLTGFGVGAKQRQGVINLTKQIIGKGFEGGVLRKEDESKYEKILPTLSDHPDVVKAKVENLKKTLAIKRQTFMETLSDGGYDTSAFAAREKLKPAPSHDSSHVDDLIKKYGGKP